MKPTRNQTLVENAIRIAKAHRESCKGETCDISLTLLAQVILMAGLHLTKKQFREFI